MTSVNIKAGRYSSDSSLTGFNVPPHDYISLAYSGANMTGVTYKQGGASGTTVATLTLTYNGSGNVVSITKG